ncbi:MAG: sigma-70 family RNA polymerase sigma factor [Planctomycetes bacterium]|nr:sigma-70 family RNA polymerase sigma factor [Planctomycetota bacterium]
MGPGPLDPREELPDAGAATRELLRWSSGDPSAAERLLPLVYAELRSLAGGVFRGQPADLTLQPTALVHEAWLRLVRQDSVGARDHEHFLAVAATAMRQILADHARRRRAQKRVAGGRRETWLEPPTPSGAEGLDLVLLDEALTRLEGVDPRQHRIVELRFFGGLDMEQIARVLETSKATVEREWRAARAWLGARMRESGAS